MDRRSFLRFSAAAVLATQVRSLRAAAGDLRLRVGACDWTLRLSTKPEVMDLAKRIGLDGVQVDYGRDVGPDGRLPLFAEKLQDAILQRAADTGVAVPSLAMGVLNQIPLKADPAAAKWVLDSVAVARRMKTPVVLLAFFSKGDLRNDPAGFDAVVGHLKKLAPLAQEAGVTYGIESLLKVPDLERMLDAVKSPAIQVYYDVGNMDREGEDYAAAIKRLGKERICEFHAKDFKGLYGQGNIDFAKVRDAIRTAGFTSGWMHIEGTQIPNGVEQDIRHDLKHLREVFGAR
jgi:sugar phosphate isomerase/epimerase